MFRKRRRRAQVEPTTTAGEQMTEEAREEQTEADMTEKNATQEAREPRAEDSGGAEFDPELHEAVDTIEVEPERDHTVTAEYSRGYKMGGQLLRPARVQVGRAKNTTETIKEE